MLLWLWSVSPSPRHSLLVCPCRRSASGLPHILDLRDLWLSPTLSLCSALTPVRLYLATDSSQTTRVSRQSQLTKRLCPWSRAPPARRRVRLPNLPQQLQQLDLSPSPFHTAQAYRSSRTPFTHATTLALPTRSRPPPLLLCARPSRPVTSRSTTHHPAPHHPQTPILGVAAASHPAHLGPSGAPWQGGGRASAGAGSGGRHAGRLMRTWVAAGAIGGVAWALWPREAVRALPPPSGEVDVRLWGRRRGLANLTH